MTTKLTTGETGFAAHCADTHSDILFSDRAEWVAHQKTAHRNTAARFRPTPAPRIAVSISAAESAQLGRWVTDPSGKFGQIISLAPGRDQVWVSFGGSDIGRFATWELTSSAAPEHTLSLPDAPATAPVSPVAAAPVTVALEVIPEPTRAPVATRTPRRRRTPARPIGHTGTDGAAVAAYWKSIEARYFAAIA